MLLVGFGTVLSLSYMNLNACKFFSLFTAISSTDLHVFAQIVPISITVRLSRPELQLFRKVHCHFHMARFCKIYKNHIYALAANKCLSVLQADRRHVRHRQMFLVQINDRHEFRILQCFQNFLLIVLEHMLPADRNSFQKGRKIVIAYIAAYRPAPTHFWGLSNAKVLSM